MVPDVRQDERKGLPVLRMRVLGGDTAMPVADDRVFEENRPRVDLADQPRLNVESRQELALPRLQRPGQHGNADSRSEMNERNDVEHIVPEIGLVGIGDEEPFAGYPWSPAEPSLVEIMRPRSIWKRSVDDRLDGRQKALLERPEERVPPDQAIPRN